MRVLNLDWVSPPFDIVRVAHVELVVTDLAAARSSTSAARPLPHRRDGRRALPARARGAAPPQPRAAPRSGAACRPRRFRVRHRRTTSTSISSWYESLGCPGAVVDGVELGPGPGRSGARPARLPARVLPRDGARRVPAPALRRLPRRADHPDRPRQPLRPRRGAAPTTTTAGSASAAPSTLRPTRDERLVAAWLYRKPTVHDVALTTGRGPRLHHLAFTTAETSAITVPLRHAGRRAVARA